MAWFQQIIYLYEYIRPVLDIALLAFLIYKGYGLLVKTQAIQLIKGAGLLALVYGIAFIFKLTTLQWVLSFMGPVLFILIIVVFQPELRKIIIRLGQGKFFRKDTRQHSEYIDAVVSAAQILSGEKRGMLAVFSRKINIRNIIETGIRINGEITTSLITAIFLFDGPLHDGAIVIHNGKMAAAGCFLPLSELITQTSSVLPVSASSVLTAAASREQQEILKSLGARHRAALGMSEQSDAVTLAVSEETGALSLSYDAKLYYDLTSAEVMRKLKELLDRTHGAASGTSKKETAKRALQKETPAEKNYQGIPVEQ
jgi:diadenylate cyclase